VTPHQSPRPPGTISPDDGVALGRQIRGSGDDVVFVHGTSADATRWAPVIDHLGSHRRCTSYDRRGRGRSGDDQCYELGREVADLLSVIRHANADGPTHVVAHSYGALVALAAGAAAPDRFESLVLYEAPVAFPDASFIDPARVAELERVLAGEGGDAAVTFFQREFPRSTPHDIAAMRLSPMWQARVASAHTIARELRAALAFDPVTGGQVPVSVPILLIVGSDSVAPFATSAAGLQRLMPHARRIDLPGQRHRAIDAIPQRFAAILKEFQDDVRARAADQ